MTTTNGTSMLTVGSMTANAAILSDGGGYWLSPHGHWDKDQKNAFVFFDESTLKLVLNLLDNTQEYEVLTWSSSESTWVSSQ